jgi:F0F1-type ATP synthase membrane subunit a
LRVFLVFVCGDKFSVYISKRGDFFLKTIRILAIELVSEISRPVALTVRLTVNVLVGHLFCSSLFSLFELVLGGKWGGVVLFAIFLECFVFFIQRYIFSRLIFLYLGE